MLTALHSFEYILYEMFGKLSFILTHQTGDSSIFTVDTVMIANSNVGAVHKLGFCAETLHIIQKDGTSSLAKEGL